MLACYASEKLRPNKFNSEYLSSYKVEIDEMYSFVNSKGNKVWIWVLLDKISGKILAHTTGDRSEKTFKKLLKSIPKDIRKKLIFHTDSWKAYNILDSNQRVIGKEHTRKIERLFLTFRDNCARLVRRGIRFSKSLEIHNTVIDLLIYFYNNEL